MTCSITPAARRTFVDAARTWGSRSPCSSRFIDFEGCPRERLQRNIDRAERKFDLMQELGAELMLLCSNVQADALGDRETLLGDLTLIAERAGARGLRVGYEALAWGRHVKNWRDVWTLVRQVDHPALGVILDSFHTLALRDPSQRNRRYSG